MVQFPLPTTLGVSWLVIRCKFFFFLFVQLAFPTTPKQCNSVHWSPAKLQPTPEYAFFLYPQPALFEENHYDHPTSNWQGLVQMDLFCWTSYPGVACKIDEGIPRLQIQNFPLGLGNCCHHGGISALQNHSFSHDWEWLSIPDANNF